MFPVFGGFLLRICLFPMLNAGKNDAHQTAIYLLAFAGKLNIQTT
jgi:hypothetical protein